MTLKEDGARCAFFRTDDPWLSSRHARIMRVMGRFLVEDLGSKNGTFVRGVQEERAELRDGDILSFGHCFLLFHHAVSGATPSLPTVELDSIGEAGFSTLVPSWADALQRTMRVARSPIAMVLHGETGTGKEVLARSIHQMSGRKGEFVAVNCGALPRDLVEAEFFGHRKGAFSGATEDRPGLFRSADHGTLLLDEIGDMPLTAQATLLRALQEGEVRPVGSSRAVAVDVRVIAATHRNLDQLVEAGQFRADLYARLAGHQVELPPLRDRKADLGMFVATALNTHNSHSAPNVRFSPAACRALLNHSWPGNVRELHKCIATALVLAGEETMDVVHLPDVVQRSLTSASSVRKEEEAARKQELIRLLREHEGNLSKVARAIGKARVQVQRWVKRYGLDAEQFRPADVDIKKKP